MRKVSEANASRAHRSTAAEAGWQQWISQPGISEPAAEPARNGHPVTVAGQGQPSHEAIAALAYALWEQRGCPVGSPEEDWLRAERQLQLPQ